MSSETSLAIQQSQSILSTSGESRVFVDDLQQDVRSSRMFYHFSFLLGMVAMGIAGYFLIVGLSKFGGDDTTRNILIVGAILFQIIESFCFVAAAGFAHHSRFWKTLLFALGFTLFMFSLLVMTLAQKTALQSSEVEAETIDAKTAFLAEQISSYESLIVGYRHNAEKQSRSIYKDSRQAGQDSLNKAAALEEKKLILSDELFALRNQRKQTSMDFFRQLEILIGVDATKLEWYFLIGRAILFELCGIILLSFGVTFKGRHMKKYFECLDNAGIVPVANGSGNNTASPDTKSADVPATVAESTASGTGENTPSANRESLTAASDQGKTPDNTKTGGEYRHTEVIKPQGKGCDSEISAGTALAGENVSADTGTGSTKHRAGTIKENVADTSGGRIAPTDNVVPFGQARRKHTVLNNLDDATQAFVERVIFAHRDGELKKITRENVRCLLKIGTRKASRVTKLAKAFLDSQKAGNQ